jgi:putative phosphoribosyl transferase
METVQAHTVQIHADHARLTGILGIPHGATGVVLFAHGSGSGRLSPRNQFVAGELRHSGIATLLLDLLEEWEASDRQKVFDIDLLADRLLTATDWVQSSELTKDLAVGYFGASTGAGAAIQAAAKRGEAVGAIVSRGGRPDLARDYLPQVTAPTLLVVGGEDYPVIDMNRDAYELLRSPKEMIIVPGATHLFEESGKLEEVAKLAAEWFRRYLGPGKTD